MKKRILASLMSVVMVLTMLPAAFAAELNNSQDTFNTEYKNEITLSYGTDGNGEITEWMLKGDVTRDQHVSYSDIQILEGILIGDEFDWDELEWEAADVTGDNHYRYDDLSALYSMSSGRISLPEEHFTFRIIDKPNDGYWVSGLTVNGEKLNVPSVGSSASTTINGAEYKVDVDEEGIATVIGQSLYQNDVEFTHSDGSWYYEVYYEYFEDGEASWVEYEYGQGGKTAPSETVTIAPESWNGEDLGWEAIDGSGNEKLGTHYVYDPDYPDTDEHSQRLSALCSEATEDNPLKIYYRAALHDVTYEYTGKIPNGANKVLPETEKAAYSSTVEIAPAPTLRGYTFSGWKIKSPDGMDDLMVDDNTFLMPNENVTLVGSWKKASPELISWYYEVLYQSYNVADENPEDCLIDENGYPYMWKSWRFGNNADFGSWDQTVTIDPKEYYGDNGKMDWDDVTGEQKEQVGVHYIYDENFPNEASYQQRLSAKASEATSSNPLQVYYRANVNNVIYQYEGDVPEGANDVLPQQSEAPYKAQVQIAESPKLDGYIFSGWKVKSPEYMEEKELIGDGTFTMPNEDVTLVGSWTKATEPPTITIKAVDMGAYTGGESISGDSFPTPRYIVDAPEGVDLSKITFQYEGEPFQVTKENTPVAISALDEVFIYDEDSVKHDAIEDASIKNLIALLAGDESAAKSDIEPGEYKITLEDADGITVQDDNAKVEFTPGTLTVRYVSDPERIVSKNDNFSTPALTEAPTAQREDGMAIGVLSEGTEIKTNGLDSLGVLGIEGEAEIHLMFDGLLPAVEGGDGSVREQMLIDRAKALGYTLTEGQYQYKYLDLINAHDGNAWVTSSQGVDVYWPYPAGTDSSYTFYVLLYDDVNREYGIGTTDKLENQINSSTISKFTGTPTDAGVKFHLNEGDFGPCALVWTKTEEPAAKYTVTFKPGDHGTLSGAAADGSVQISGIASGTKLTAGQIPAVNADGKYSFTGWLGSDGKTYSNSDILALAITSNMTFTAQYKKDSGSGGGGGGGGTTYYTLRYESNGGTEYKDERYARNTVVELDKVPTREGYTFTGWYADEELTERITETKMTSNKTVYAGWEPTGVPDWLNGKDHFAYVVGYTDGTVRPLNNISRAEVATIFFRLLNEDIREENLTTSNTFADVNEGMWCNTAISTMAKLGIVKGRSQEHFDPDAPITRAEFAAICARFDTSKRDGDSDFTDIAGHWAEAEIERAATLGWIMGYTDSTFRPENYITRAEAMTMINRVLNRLPESEDDLLDSMNVWPDNQPGAWYYLAVQEATNSHDFNRKGDVHEHWTKLTADPDWTKYQ